MVGSERASKRLAERVVASGRRRPTIGFRAMPRTAPTRADATRPRVMLSFEAAMANEEERVDATRVWLWTSQEDDDDDPCSGAWRIAQTDGATTFAGGRAKRVRDAVARRSAS